jgi:hypothetical protein
MSSLAKSLLAIQEQACIGAPLVVGIPAHEEVSCRGSGGGFSLPGGGVSVEEMSDEEIYQEEGGGSHEAC